jgi:hypothetical protein
MLASLPSADAEKLGNGGQTASFSVPVAIYLTSLPSQAQIIGFDFFSPVMVMINQINLKNHESVDDR